MSEPQPANPERSLDEIIAESQRLRAEADRLREQMETLSGELAKYSVRDERRPENLDPR